MRIQGVAEQTRKAQWPDGSIPIDVDLVLERMGIDIIPVANLRRHVGVEACIAADLASIYLDLEYAMDERMNHRVRFSLAHELGHVILHGHVFKEFRDMNLTTVLAWAEHIRERFDTQLLENEANEFAGCFLLPKSDLQQTFDRLYPTIIQRFSQEGMDPERLKVETIHSYMANAIGPIFQVSPAVVRIQLKRYKIRSSQSS